VGSRARLTKAPANIREESRRKSTLIRRRIMVAVKNLAGKCLACTVLFGSSALLAWTLPLLAWAAFKF
jgi:hypothetical protein